MSGGARACRWRCWGGGGRGCRRKRDARRRQDQVRQGVRCGRVEAGWRGVGVVGWMGARGGAMLNPATSGVCGRVGERHANEAVATTKRAERERVC